MLLFSRDLRVEDHPALVAAVGRGAVLPLFVFDDALIGARSVGPNRLAFLLESLTDLRASLRALGGELFVRQGEPAAIATSVARALGASMILCSADVGRVAARRRLALSARAGREGIAILEAPGVSVVDPGLLSPAGGDHYRVFTPYWRAWTRAPRRAVLDPPTRVEIPGSLEPGVLPDLSALISGQDSLGDSPRASRGLAPCSPGRERGGEMAAWERIHAFAKDGLEDYATRAAQLSAHAGSRLSAALHFGCCSPLALERHLTARRPPVQSGGVDAFMRQLCWRDFFLSVAHAFPAIATCDYRNRRREPFRRDATELAAWKSGETGVALVDAAMRQLLAEGYVHNRARLVAASYLTKTLNHDWREGAAHYGYWLTDADVASNAGNWQWVAGTGNDTRPNRRLNPSRQAERFDAAGTYVARYLQAGRQGP